MNQEKIGERAYWKKKGYPQKKIKKELLEPIIKKKLIEVILKKRGGEKCNI